MNLFAFAPTQLPATPGVPTGSRPRTAVTHHRGVLPRFDQRLSVHAAYARHRRQRTPFGEEGDSARDTAGLAPAARWYLRALFAAVDQAVVLREESVTLRMADADPSDLARARRGYRALVCFLKDLSPPSALEVAHRQVVDAVTRHGDFFRACDAGETDVREPHAIARHADVRAASARLQSAHSALMSSFPHVSAHNRQAFFDHLSALDFI